MRDVHVTELTPPGFTDTRAHLVIFTTDNRDDPSGMLDKTRRYIFDTPQEAIAQVWRSIHQPYIAVVNGVDVWGVSLDDIRACKTAQEAIDLYDPMHDPGSPAELDDPALVLIGKMEALAQKNNARKSTDQKLIELCARGWTFETAGKIDDRGHDILTILARHAATQTIMQFESDRMSYAVNGVMKCDRALYS